MLINFYQKFTPSKSFNRNVMKDYEILTNHRTILALKVIRMKRLFLHHVYFTQCSWSNPIA